MPASPAARTTARTDSAPSRWPSTRGKCRCLAQRPLPSMMMATCAGRLALACSLRWGVLIAGEFALRVPRFGFQVSSFASCNPLRVTTVTSRAHWSSTTKEDEEVAHWERRHPAGVWPCPAGGNSPAGGRRSQPNQVRSGLWWCYSNAPGRAQLETRNSKLETLNSQKNRLIPCWTDGHNGQPGTGKLYDGLEILPATRRQVPELAHPPGRLPPSGEIDVDRFALRKDFDVVRDIVKRVLARPIADADANPLERIQSVDVRHRQFVESVDHRRVARRHSVEPAAAPGAARGRAKFAAQAMQQIGDLRALRGQGPFAHACGVSL